MPRAGFYNDNEYRAYPFVFKANYGGSTRCPDSAIVDCGFIMGLDSGYDPATDFVYLKSIERTSQSFIFEFGTTASGAENYPILFERSITGATEWESEFSESAPNAAQAFCATEPAWEGYLVTGLFSELTAILPTPAKISFYAPATNSGTTPDYEVEPARVQSLVKAYVRSINVGNYERVKVTTCVDSSTSSSSSSSAAARKIIPYSAATSSSIAGCAPNAPPNCMSGDIKIKGGFNCVVQQTNYDNKILLIPRKDANIYDDPNEERCQYGSEIPICAGEQPPDDSEFLSGGPACGDVITSINGIGGKNVKIIGGTGVQIVASDANTLQIGLNATVVQQNC